MMPFTTGGGVGYQFPLEVSIAGAARRVKCERVEIREVPVAFGAAGTATSPQPVEFQSQIRAKAELVLGEELGVLMNVRDGLSLDC